MNPDLVPMTCPKGHESWLGRKGEACWTCGSKPVVAKEESDAA